MADLAGAYELRSVAGKPLPAVVRASSTTTYVVRETRTLRAGGTCSSDATYDYKGNIYNPGFVYDWTIPCTWALAGDVITFSWVDRGVAYTSTATYSEGHTLTEMSHSPLSPSDVPYVFRK